MRGTLPAALFCLLLLSAGCSRSAAPAPGQAGERACSDCHFAAHQSYAASAHSQAGVSCAACHAGAQEHLQDTRVRPQTDWRGESCAACHQVQHSQWLTSPHAQIPLDLLPRDPRIGECMKCHQARGFAAVLASGQDFKKAWGPPPQSEPEPVTCAACHSPHGEGGQLLRLPRAELCAACHGGKWQNLVLEGSGGYHYATAGWSTFSAHPHNGGDRCVTCHMASTASAKDTGGHTFRMRVPAGGEPNTAGCAACHGQLEGYDTGGVQSAVRDLLGQLRLELELRNGGKLPGFQPGACNQCHRGGTLPFDHDPDLVLEKAYENYKLVDRDKSLGVHNPPYVLRLLQESINSVRQDYRQ